MHDHGERVGGDLELGVLDAVLLAGRDLLLLDRAGGVGDVGLAGAELLEAATGAGLADRDLDVGVLLAEQLRGRVAQREDGRRAVDGDGAAEAPSPPSLPASSPPQADEGQGEGRRCRARSPGGRKCSSLRSPESVCADIQERRERQVTGSGGVGERGVNGGPDGVDPASVRRRSHELAGRALTPWAVLGLSELASVATTSPLRWWTTSIPPGSSSGPSTPSASNTVGSTGRWVHSTAPSPAVEQLVDHAPRPPPRWRPPR